MKQNIWLGSQKKIYCSNQHDARWWWHYLCKHWKMPRHQSHWVQIHLISVFLIICKIGQNDHACLHFRQDFFKLANSIIPELGILFTALNLQMIGITVLCLSEYALISLLELAVTHHPSLCQTLTQCCCNGAWTSRHPATCCSLMDWDWPSSLPWLVTAENVTEYWWAIIQSYSPPQYLDIAK